MLTGWRHVPSTGVCLRLIHNNNYIYRTDLSNPNNVTNSTWQVGSYPIGVSVNNAGNVLVTCNSDHKLQEYTTRGILIREINLQQAGITNPWHSIQLTNDQFLVTHHHRVCVVNASGELVSSYGSTTAGSANGQLNFPVTVATVKNGCILIADRNNNRIKIWNRNANN
jgi:DNA-binding beta-propeller fold protein YncE